MIALLNQFFLKSRHLILYGLAMAILVFLLKWLQWKYLITDNSLEIYIGLLALLFTALGVWIAAQLTKPKVKTIIIEKEVYLPYSEDFKLNEEELNKLNLTNREYDVLQQLMLGHSNAEIAKSLFLSVSTVKTHASNLFAKMEVKNRFRAVEKAKRLKIAP